MRIPEPARAGSSRRTKPMSNNVNEWPHGRAHTVVLTVATIAGLYACSRLFLPFVPAFAWALTGAVLWAPLHRRIERRLNENLAAGASVAAVAAIVFVPGVMVAGR